MATNSSFGTMLKRYMPNNLLVESMKKRNYLFRKVKKDQSWMGGRYEVPFEGGEASTVKLGSLASSSDISETDAVLGYEDSYREIWGSMKFNQKDLDLNNDLKGSFLKLLPNKLNQFLSRMEADFSHQILLGTKIDALTANATNGGLLTVSFPERFSIGQKCQLRNDDPAAIDVYVIAINMSTKVLTVSATRGGSAVDASAYTLAKESALYLDGGVNTTSGAIQNNFNSLRDSLLSLANGGSASIHNQTKVSYPFLQAHQEDGSGITASTVIDGLFDAFYEVTRIGKGMPTEILVSFKHFASMSKELELNKRYTASDSASGYGFVSIKVRGPQGSMIVTALREMDDDVAFIIDWNAIVLAGSHFFDKGRFNNSDYFVERATTGATYIVDVRLYGNLIVTMPSYCGVVHSISY